MQQDSKLQSLETLLLVVIESLLTLLLRFDSELRQKAYPLVMSDTLIAVRSYLPHDEIYLTFTFKGVLLDSEIPEHKQRPDVIINAHSFEIINAIISDQNKAVEKLQFRGDAHQVELVTAFLQSLSISGVVQGFINRILSKQTKSSDAEKNNAENKDTKKPKTDYKAKFTEVKEEHRQLKIDHKRLSTEVAELKSRQWFFSILALIGLVLGLFIGWLVF